MSPPAALRQALAYEPVELEFGTSGLRGRVKDITDLEAYVATSAFLQFLGELGAGRQGSPVHVAGDLRPSTEGILVPVCRAIADAGFTPVYLGRIPSPALLAYAMKRGAASVMVTGSHIPFDRNGIKLNRPDGEVRKADERTIREAQQRLRARQYEAPFDRSRFDENGALRADFRAPLPDPVPDAGLEYVRRYTEAFPPDALAGTRILVYQHSAVGRDLLPRVLESLGAQALTAGRSDSFVPVDTEAVNDDMLRVIQDLVDANGGRSLDAVVSTDGDSDRPLVLGLEDGRVRFYPGDLLGIVTADFLGAREIAVPISVNDAVDLHFLPRGIRPVKTRIGSPYVIEALKQVGWEANGGFLTAAPLAIPGGGVLDPLPTRDALLPILAALCASLGAGITLAELFSRLPRRFGRSGLLREFPREKAQAILKKFSPVDPSVMEARPDSEGAGLGDIRREIGRFFKPGDGFSDVAWINWMDGLRIGFQNGDIAHVRPSGNAPELRMYATANTPERADAIVKLGTAEGGILRQLEKAVDEERLIEAFRASPGILQVEGAVQHYAWGGFQFIPSLLGQDNPDRLPYAELWFGAHPAAPARALMEGSAVALDRLLEEASPQVLGARDWARFGGRLPFLLKVLDARTMLSIQAHPNRQQAAEGFARENARGVPREASQRLYRDDNPKPEVHVALSEFWMLHGFRPLEQIRLTLDSAPELAEVMPDFPARLREAGDKAGRQRLLQSLYGVVMTMPQEKVDALLSPLLQRLAERERTRGLDKETPDFWALRAARELPLPGGHRDRGIFSIYLLNLLHLHPGEGTYQPAGTLHAYLEGTNVELMANSDNVLRGGLTPKSVDTEELLRIVTYQEGPPEVLAGKDRGKGIRLYETPAEEFQLERLTISSGGALRAAARHSAESLVVIRGPVSLDSPRQRLRLSKGKGLLVPADVPYQIASEASESLVFRASVPGPRG